MLYLEVFVEERSCYNGYRINLDCLEEEEGANIGCIINLDCLEGIGSSYSVYMII